MIGEAKRRKKRVIRLKIHRDKKGRYFIFKNKKYRIGKRVKKENLAKAVKKTLFDKFTGEERILPTLLSSISTTEGVKNLENKIESLEGIEGELKNLSLPALKDLAKSLDIKTDVSKETLTAKVAKKKRLLPTPAVKKDKLRDLEEKEREYIDKGEKKLAELYKINEEIAKGKKDQWNKVDAITEEINKNYKELEKIKREIRVLKPPTKDEIEDEDKDEEVKTPVFHPQPPGEDEQMADELLAKEAIDELVGQGKRKYGLKDAGMTNLQIDKILGKYPQYLGCISCDEIDSVILPKVKAKSKGGFVINTDPSNKPGRHWQGVYFDATPGGESEINFFDSYADKPSKRVLKGLKDIVDKLDSDSLLKFKQNRIKYQNDLSSNCGYFVCDFLEKRFNGHRFPESTIFNNVVRGEANIEIYKEKHGGFKYIRGSGPLDFYSYFPPSVRKFADSGEKIVTLNVERVPIQKILDKAINIISLGYWDKAKKELGYSDMFHLYFVINDKYKLERNHVVSMAPWRPSRDAQRVRVSMNKELTIGELLKNTAQMVGPELQRYDPAKSNCQVFIKQVLQANGLAGPENAGVINFATQDVESIIKRLPGYVAPVMKGITDIAHLGEKIISGSKKKKRRLNVA